jgi:hypothetical protein
LVQFDNEYEFVHTGVPIGQVPKYTLVPRGSTALLDAVGRAINETGARLAGMNEADRPGLVLFAVVTDGYENSSREFTKSKIKEMIAHQASNYSWHFNFLGADQNAFAEGAEMGFTVGGTAAYSPSNVQGVYASVSQKFSRMRKQQSADETVYNEFSEEERKQME